MPTQLPREATDFFGGLLLPHVMDILKSDAEQVKNFFMNFNLTKKNSNIYIFLFDFGIAF